MNKSNPLLPQGSLLEQQSKGRRRVQIWVFCGIALHVLFFGGLLMLGCGEKKDDLALNAKTNSVAAPLEPIPAPTPEVATNPVTPTLPPPVATSAPPVAVPIPAPTPMPVVTPEPPVPSATKEYKVVKGDSYYTIGKKYGVSTKAMEKANPTIPATKLKPGMTLQIPAASAAAATTATPGTPGGTTPPTTEASETYTVKSGDNLTKIATSHHTTVKAMRALNGLKTDRLKVGDKLKVPAKSAAVAADATPAPPTIPSPAPGVGGVPVPSPSVVR